MTNHEIIQGDLLTAKLPREVDLVYIDPPFNTSRDFGHYNDEWKSMADYMSFLLPRITRCGCYLKDGGNMLVHMDWHAVHYIKTAMDYMEPFGYDNFQNEIVWKYNSGGASKKHLSRKHDTILWYVKGEAPHTFNILREPYATPDVEGRAGFHPEGRMLTDVWEIPFISTTGKERTGYPTQKPLALLERVIEVFSNEGDTVLDGFCGSGTTGVAAKKLKRNSVMVDRSDEAIRVTKERISGVQVA